jgi:hypothetical protein
MSTDAGTVGAMTLSPQPPGPSPSPDPTRYTARSPEDLLALAPVLLGFHPAESVVMLTFGAARSPHARCDLPHVSEELSERREALDALAESLLEPARRHRVRTIVLLLYSDDRRSAEACWHRLRRECKEAGIKVVEALRMASGRYYPLLGGDGQLRETGIPVDLGGHPFLAQAVLDGTLILDSREELISTVAPDPAAQAQIAEEVAVRHARAPVPVRRPDLLREGRWARSLVAGHVAAGSVPDDADLARLLWMMQAVRVRDAAWSLITREAAREHVALWTHAARRAPHRLAAAPAALLCWAAWMAGDGALAWGALDRCTDADPDYSMAVLLRTIVENAVDPASLECPEEWDDGLEGGF